VTYCRAFDEALHPRGPTGSPTGGQFVSADAGKGEAGGEGATDEKTAEVKAVQKLLGLEPTGRFSPADAEAVKKYQREHGLQVDGKVGAQTIASLLGEGKRAPGKLTDADRQKLRDIAAGKEPGRAAGAAPAKATAKPAAAKGATPPKPKASTATRPPAKTATHAPAKSTSTKTAPAKTAASKVPARNPVASDTGRAGNPRIAEYGRDYWEHGKGALQIRWGSPGATTRCHRLVMEHAGMGDEEAWGYCAERHHAVLGTWPGSANTGKKGKKKGRRDAGENADAPETYPSTLALPDDWDDYEDLPDLAGLSVADLEAAEAETGAEG